EDTGGTLRQRLVAAAAAVIALGGAGAVSYAIANHPAPLQNTRVSGENKQIAAVLAVPDARLQSATATGGGQVTVVSSRSLDEAGAPAAAAAPPRAGPPAAASGGDPRYPRRGGGLCAHPHPGPAMV